MSQRAFIEELERSREQLKEERDDWQRLAGEREQIVGKLRVSIEELERCKVQLELDRDNWQRLSEEFQFTMVKLEKQFWFRLGAKLMNLLGGKPETILKRNHLKGLPQSSAKKDSTSHSELKLNQKNKYLAFWEFAHGIASVESTPPNLQIAKSNICNFKCAYCVEHRAGSQVTRTKIEGKTWRKLLSLIPRSDVLSFHGNSEFMVDPKFFDTVRRCAEAGTSLSITTNGSVCTPKHLDILGNYPGFLVIDFSIDAATPETYLRIRSGEFSRIMGNIKNYVDRFEARRSRTWITLSFVITKSNVKEMVRFVSLAKELKVDGVKYYRLHEYEGLDWQVETKAGGVFNYREECTRNFGEEYNRELERTRQAAENLGIVVELPAVLTEEELKEVSL